MKHIDVRVALIFNPLPCNKVLSSVNTTYFLFLPSRMKANMQVYIRVCFVIRVAEKLSRRPGKGAFSGRRGAFCLNVHQLP